MSEINDLMSVQKACRVAIIGGGPGGLMTAYQLRQRCAASFEATIYEASSRLGGKILTKQFTSAPVAYEAGAAELYDYSQTGEDPLRELIEELGLTVQPMNGTSVVLDDKVLHDFEDVGRIYGETARQALLAFDMRAKRWMSPQEYYDADWMESNADSMGGRTFYDELAQVPNEAARRYLRTLVHSDLATEPHRTSAAYGLQNYLMNDPGYMRLYTIEGGIERLPQELAARIDARILLREPVVRVERAEGETLRIFSNRHGKVVIEDYDFVVVALPNACIPLIDWRGDALGEAIHRHCVRYDYPAHYLRVSLLFREVFWQNGFHDSYMMLDAFGGCCLYDESSRNGCRTHGVLGWLLAGDAAVIASNHTDEQLIRRVLDSFPSFLQRGRELFVEGQVHRWIDSVNGLPGGSPVLDMEQRHLPDPARPNLVAVGDYLFDSTINGVLDSADFVAEFLAEAIESRNRSQMPATAYSAAL
jgi:protoporphyrinogen oxidase